MDIWFADGTFWQHVERKDVPTINENEDESDDARYPRVTLTDSAHNVRATLVYGGQRKVLGDKLWLLPFGHFGSDVLIGDFPIICDRWRQGCYVYGKRLTDSATGNQTVSAVS